MKFDAEELAYRFTYVAIFLIFLTAFIEPARADRVDDTLAKAPREQCGIATTMSIVGFNTALKNQTFDEHVAELERMATEEDGYFRPYSARERAWYKEKWDVGAGFVAFYREKYGADPTPELRKELGQKLFGICLSNVEGGAQGLDAEPHEHNKNHNRRGFKADDARFIKMGQDLGTGAPEDRAEQIRRYPDVVYCQYVTRLFDIGVVAHREGVPAVFKHSSIAQYKSGEAPPMDAIYLVGWDDYTTNEKMFVSEFVTKGWHESNALPGSLEWTDEVHNALVARFMGQCVADRQQQ